MKESVFSYKKISNKRFSTDSNENSVHKTNMSKYYLLINLDLPHLKTHIRFVEKQEDHRKKQFRDENSRLENDLESKRRIIQAKIFENKEEVVEIIKSISELEKEISHIIIDLELENNYGKNSNVINQIAEIEKITQKKGFNKKILLKAYGQSIMKLNNLRVIKKYLIF